MKLGFFTDSHYSSQDLTCGNRHNNKSLVKIRKAYQFFEEEKCDLVICLGDLIDNDTSHQKEMENLKEIAKVINESPLKSICLMGNHDAFTFTESEFYDILGGFKPESIEIDGKTLIFIDACYFKNGNHYLPGDFDWTDTFYPNIQDLKTKLDEAAGDVYIFIHQNLDPDIPDEDYRLYNFEEINCILHKSQKVKAVYQGHFHQGMNSKHGDIKYITFSAVCENESAYYIEEI